MTSPPRKSAALLERAHGWFRASDAPGSLPTERRRARTPIGAPLLLSFFAIALAALGLVRVRASTEILGLGAQITDLTSEHSRLLELQRRLAAERAYLRHPRRIEDVARNELGMIPLAPEFVQRIQLVDPPEAP